MTVGRRGVHRRGTARRPREHNDMEICRRQLDEVGVRNDRVTERLEGNGASRAAVVVKMPSKQGLSKHSTETGCGCCSFCNSFSDEGGETRMHAYHINLSVMFRGKKWIKSDVHAAV